MVIGGILDDGLVCLNYTRGLVELFTFMILLATLNTLVPYVFSSIAVFVLAVLAPLAPGDAYGPAARRVAPSRPWPSLYSLWAIGGAGAETIYWGSPAVCSAACRCTSSS